MGRLYLVRNARTDDGTGFAENPRLDEVGQEQAEAVVRKLGHLRRPKILTSPQRRAMETVAPLARHCLAMPVVDEALTLMPLPSAESCDREAWLLAFMESSWRDAPPLQRRWRESCLFALAGLTGDVVIASHFIVINMIVGAAIGDDRVVIFKPDNGSITTLDVTDGKLSLVELGRQAATRPL
ncbi:MAG: histidine phosphatase family protein [Alphaproteobacteria bacterium]|nr:histidine phosphatase family protein [Alphaproteobacteria bacterium]